MRSQRVTIAKLIPMKRELKVGVLKVYIHGVSEIAKLIPMKRELKVKVGVAAAVGVGASQS